jgi:NADPH-dependent 7-cyano-7-deazaguanine reductase QueF
MNVMPNREPDIQTTVELTTPIADLCPHSHEPQTGSTLTVRYRPSATILELHAVVQWLPSQCAEAIDLETLCQRAARDASAALGVEATAIAHYVLRGGITLRCESQSS